MKTKILIILYLFSIKITAQNYGMRGYNHTNADMSSAQKCTLLAANPGYVMASRQWGLSGGATANFYIDRTDVQGAFNSNSFEFQNYYEVYHDANCGGTSTQVDSIYGISIIESILNGPSRYYAIAGTCELGLFFATLDLGGAVVDQKAYPFPSGSTRITKPLIVESASTSGIYYIVGSYYYNGKGYLYALKIDDQGNIQFSKTFNPISDIDLIPMDIIISPYYSEVVVVGKAYGGAGSAGFENRGFFLQLDDSNLTLVQCTLYGQNLTFGVKPNDFLTTIALNTTQVGGQPGFIVAGQTDTLSNLNFWTMKLDPTGNILWNKAVILVTDQSPKVIPVDIVERPSAFYQQHVYYVACTSSVGILVVKLDSIGDYFVPNPFNAVDATSEFIFDNGPSISSPVALDYDNNSTSNDYGLQVMGDYNIGTGNQCFVNAAFNGATPYLTGNIQCLFSSVISSGGNAPGVHHKSNISLQTTNGLALCPNISINTYAYSAFNMNLCWGGLTATPPPSFNRPSSILESARDNIDINVYPNPTTGTLKINTGGGIKQNVIQVSLIDLFGRKIIQNRDIKLNEQFSGDLDFSNNNLADGIYYLEVVFDSGKKTEKIVVNGNK